MAADRGTSEFKLVVDEDGKDKDSDDEPAFHAKTDRIILPNEDITIVHGRYQEGVIPLPPDIMHAYVILKLYNVWEKFNCCTRFIYVLTMIICVVTQFTILIILYCEKNEDIDDEDDENELYSHGPPELVVSKLASLILVGSQNTIQLFAASEIYKLYHNLPRKWKQDKHIKKTCLYLSIYNIVLAATAFLVCVKVIIESESATDAVFNALAVSFVCELDDWLYTLISNEIFINEDDFNIRYKIHKYIPLKYYIRSKARSEFYGKLKCKCTCNFWRGNNSNDIDGDGINNDNIKVREVLGNNLLAHHQYTINVKLLCLLFGILYAVLFPTHVFDFENILWHLLVFSPLVLIIAIIYIENMMVKKCLVNETKMHVFEEIILPNMIANTDLLMINQDIVEEAKNGNFDSIIHGDNYSIDKYIDFIYKKIIRKDMYIKDCDNNQLDEIIKAALINYIRSKD